MESTFDFLKSITRPTAQLQTKNSDPISEKSCTEKLVTKARTYRGTLQGHGRRRILEGKTPPKEIILSHISWSRDHHTLCISICMFFFLGKREASEAAVHLYLQVATVST